MNRFPAPLWREVGRGRGVDLMSGDACRVTIGLPVFNGEKYLAEAITSILDQTYTDFRLILADNASTDRTSDICKSFEKTDDRIRYVRHERNIGGIKNFNYVLSLNKSEYFKWVAHDDLCKPEFLQLCVEALDADPQVILAYPQTIDIDEQGRYLKLRDTGLGLDAQSPYERFRRLIVQGHGATMLYGLHRASVLMQALPQGSYYGSDRPLLGELALRGRFIEVPAALFLRRQHSERSVRMHDTSHGAPDWFRPETPERATLPAWRRLAFSLRVIHRVPIGTRDRLRCYLLMARWIRGVRSALWLDLKVAARKLTTRPGEALNVTVPTARVVARREASSRDELGKGGIMMGTLSPVLRRAAAWRGRLAEQRRRRAYRADPRSYWNARHEAAKDSLRGVGCHGLGEAENAEDYEAKWKQVAKLMDRLAIQAGQRVLDAGCGIGFFAKQLAESGLVVEGVDFSREALEVADRDNPNGVVWHVGQLDEFRLGSTFDAVLCLDVLFHVVDDETWTASVRNMAEHVSPTGRLIIQEELVGHGSARSDRAHVRRRTLDTYRELLTGWTLSEHAVYELPRQGNQKDLLCFTRD